MSAVRSHTGGSGNDRFTLSVEARMPIPGEPRFARLGILFVLLFAVVGVWWWRGHTGDTPATSSVTQPQHAAPGHATVTPRAAPAEPARVVVTVTDDKGPVPGAVVRLAPAVGDVVVLSAGADGVARADHLEPGKWRISAAASDHLPAALPVRELVAGAESQVAIKLAAGGRTLSGTVADATGGPIAGARIDAARLSATGDASDAVAAVFSGPDGKYRMTVAEGALMVAATSPDYAPQSHRVVVGPAGAVVDFALVPGGVIEGIVRDERNHQPVAGAAVTARRDSPSLQLVETGARRATSGTDGKFRIGGLRPGAWELSATAEARYTRHRTIVGLGVAEQVGDIELLIGAGPVIRGRVVDEAGAAAPGVTVSARARGEGAEDKADANGAFVLEGLGPGTYVVTARGDTLLPAGATRVPLADKDVDGVVINVKRGLALHGHVEPRQPCEIQPESDQPGAAFNLPGAFPGAASTGNDGAFQLAPLAEGPLRLTARCASGDAGSTQVTVAAGMAEVTLPVSPGGSIAGHVVDGAGKPVAGIGVSASDVSHGERTTIRNGAITSGVQAVTDASGAYQLVGLSPGSYRMGALDRGRPLRLRAEAPAVELAAAEHKTGVDLAVDRPSGVITGTVTGPDGKPMADAWVSVQQDLFAMLAGDRPGPPQSRMVTIEARDGGGDADSSFPPALTDAQGHYAIRGLPPATYTVIAEAQRGQLRARATDIKPDATVDLKVAVVTALSGTVTGPSGPVALFSVELEGPTRTQRSFTDGKFAFDRVDPGSYTVRVQSSDGHGEAKVDVTPDAPATVAIALAANAVVVGKLVDPDGKPLAGQVVVLTPDRGDGRLQVRIEGAPPTTGPDGSFRIEHAAEPCALMVMRPPSPFSKRGLALVAGKTLDLGTITVTAASPPAGSGAPAH
jgi:hypothetical protein